MKRSLSMISDAPAPSSRLTYKLHEYSESGRRLRIVERTVESAVCAPPSGTSVPLLPLPPVPGGGFDSVWSAYDTMGPTAYYENHGASYRNPHEPTMAAALSLSLSSWDNAQLMRPLHRVLDLACGSGEASVAFEHWAAANADSSLLPHLEGADPHTAAAFKTRTGKSAHPWSFEDVAGGQWAREGLSWDLVMCSYALHLVDEVTLHATLSAVAHAARLLLVLTPHRRPTDAAVSKAGWTQQGALTLEHVRVRLYRSQLYPQ